jgi:hypothetical protein
MPIRRVKGGYQWGSRGKVYKKRSDAAKQAAAAYASGYREGMDLPSFPPQKLQEMRLRLTVIRNQRSPEPAFVLKR